MRRLALAVLAAALAVVAPSTIGPRGAEARPDGDARPAAEARPDVGVPAAAPDPHALAGALAARGFEPPPDFKMLVALPDRAGRGPAFDWCGTSDDRGDWWPASSVKLFAAIAALEKVRGLGLPPNAWVRYDYPERPPVTMRLSRIVHLAIAPSSNANFDRLVELVGYDAINRDFFTAEHGLADTVFRRAYTDRLVDEASGHGIFRDSPPIRVYLGRRAVDLPARRGVGHYDCPDLGNCTTLGNLAEAMRRVMFHEALPESERYDLGPDELRVLRSALAGERPRGNNLPEAVARGLGGDPAGHRFFHKPGYALRWISEVMLVHREADGRRFLVAGAARPGRRALDDALERVGAVLAGGDLEDPSRRAALRRRGRRVCAGEGGGSPGGR